MTRREVHAMAALILVITAGLGIRAYKDQAASTDYLLIEQGKKAPRFNPAGNSPPLAYTSPDSHRGTVEPAPIMYDEKGRLDLNRATAVALDALPRIGPSRAEAILEYRKTNGHFQSISELLEVHGIGEKTLALLEPLVYVDAPSSDEPDQREEDTSPVPYRSLAIASPGNSPGEKVDNPPENDSTAPETRAGWININTATKTELQQLWNIGPERAQDIIEWREKHGRFSSLEALQDVPGIGPATVQRNRDRMTYK